MIQSREEWSQEVLSPADVTLNRDLADINTFFEAMQIYQMHFRII